MSDSSFVDNSQKTDSDISDEEHEESASWNHKWRQSEGVSIPETDSDSAEEEIIMRRKRLPIAIFDSDSDEEDNYFENRALSPQTRLSITGIRPKDISSDESEKSENESSNVGVSISVSKTNSENSKSDHSSNQLDDLSNSENFNKGNTSNTDIEIIQVQSESLTKKSFSTFNYSIANKLSSTLTAVNVIPNSQIESPKSAMKSNDSIAVLSVKNETINISSASDTSSIIESSTPIIIDQTARHKNLLQTKLTSLDKTPTTSRPIYVSPEYLNKELRQLEALKTELNTCVNLTKVSQNLPDGGSKMLDRIEKLKIEIKKQANKISNLVVDEKSIKKPEVGFVKPLSWDELAAAANEIQPKFTGKIGIATFTAQKALTIDRLKDIHGSLENCPNESVLADDPKGLKVTLMDHQKHALTWMEWREKQKPRGGILADDMGLGKTLSMISLILMSKIRNETIDQKDSSDDESDEKSNNNGWSSKGRKDYHNGGNLVVAPASLIKQWESEAENRTKRHLLSICVHHGNNRDTKARHLAKYDIVVTTYNIVSREFKSLSSLFGVKWERIILDEAHVIRNHKSQSSIAVCGLKGKYRWALTGTPIQNKEMDLYPILKFLKCSPFDDLQHWKKWIDNKSAGGQQRLNTLIKSLMLRRTKVQLQERGELMCLPEKETTLIDVKLDKDEMNVYQKIMIFSRTLFAQFLHQRAEKSDDMYYESESNRQKSTQKAPNDEYYKMHQKIVRLHGSTEVKSHEILVLLLRLRQICCHPGLINAMLEDENDITDVDSSKENSGLDVDLLDQLEKLQINGEDEASSSTNLDGSKDMAISKASSKVLLKSNPVFDLSRLSSKMIKIIEILEERVLNTKDKAIIVSQWTSVLNLLQTHLARKKISCCCLNGTVPVKFRNDIVTKFNNETSTERIMLLSLTAGGVGLNLIGANHLFLIDLHWNPQLESQAQDRIYRVGQKKHVYIYKFMCKDTIEERIKVLQDNKLAIANGVLTGSKSVVGSKLTMDDLKSLFGI